jgi:PKD repeat protein
LTVTDTNNVSASTSQVVSVGPGQGPSADFTFSPSNPAMNQDIQFNGSTSRAGTGHTLVRYDWNFGSGSPQSGVAVTKAYDTAGTYNVTLTVTDEVGQSATIAKSVTIGNTGSLTASFTMSPSNPRVGNTVNFNGSGSTAAPGFTITSYAWDFGDGTTATGATSSHVYGLAATYIVRLTITDSAGRTTFSTQNLTVAP